MGQEKYDTVHGTYFIRVCISRGQAANRDPRRWTEPDRFGIRGNANGHVVFGMGVHRCVGQTVARLEGEIVLTALARRVERIEFTGQPARKANNTLLAWSSLPVAIHPL